ncbi:MAG: BrnA antitoxin family protein [Betaproteobacteria bacterium]|nr:BrnA antitoxin family protein [Betaproteobacteria bacterium]
MIVSKGNLKLKAPDPAPEIDWAAVDAKPLADAPDEDSPELTAVQRKELRPLGEVLPGLTTGKTRITIMLDDAVLAAYKARAGGRGYQTLINEALRRALEADAIKEALRQVIREERAA